MADTPRIRFSPGAGVSISFRDSDGTGLGYIRYHHATSSEVFTKCAIDPRPCAQIRLADGAKTVYDFTGADILSAIGLDDSEIAIVSISFSVGTTAPGTMNGHVWFDDFRYEATGWVVGQ